MSWSNAPSKSRNGLQTFSQWRAERGPRQQTSIKHNPAYHDHLNRKRQRPTGSSLKPIEVAGLVDKALASGGPIAAGEPFEHLLVVNSDNFHIHMYHFIVAEPHAGQQRRVVLLSERTLHIPIDLRGPCREREFIDKLVKYATALGAPRMIVNDSAIAYKMMRSVPHSLRFTDSHVMWKELCTGPREKFGDNIAVGLARYRRALETGCVQHPELKILADQARDAEIKPYNGGPLEVVRPDINLGRDIMAMILAYVERDLSQVLERTYYP
ncbi:hypothetical protein ACIPL1_27345 [Pseudomonas sp. NPDC090202]|uniref:hypothetical protein n=1 Tax=Pseudomonas sp. NPDC090202 TaxID=3364476 RepID=UPI00381BDCF1